jgi:hypothetical protein
MFSINLCPLTRTTLKTHERPQYLLQNTWVAAKFISAQYAQNDKQDQVYDHNESTDNQAGHEEGYTCWQE